MSFKQLFKTTILFLFILIINNGCTQDVKSFSELINEPDQSVSFRDIPGLTAEEISSLEDLVSSRNYFSFGTVLSAETFLLPDGNYAGFTDKLASKLSDIFGIPFVLEHHSWNDLINGIDNLTVDFFSEMTPTNEHKHKYFMTSSIAERSIYLFVPEGAQTINATNDLNGLKIGFIKNTITEQSIKDDYHDLIFESVTIDNVHEAAQMLMSGDIDAVITDEQFDYDFRSHGYIKGISLLPLVYSPISLATANPALQPVISIFNKYLNAGGFNIIKNLYTQSRIDYARSMFETSLTDEEKAYIAGLTAGNVKVKVTIEPDNYPLCFFDEKKNEFNGIAVDILKEITLLTGIEFETITDKNSTIAEIIDLIKTGAAAFDTEMIQTETRKNDFIFAKVPYFTSHFALLSRMDYPDLRIYQVARSTVGVVTGTAVAEMYDLLVPDSLERKEYRTRYEALDALEKGDIDLFLTTDFMLLHQTHFKEKTDYKINICFNSVLEKSFFAFNKNEEILCSIIDKAQSRINIEKITTDWTNRVYNYSKEIAANRLIYMAVISIMLTFMLIFLIRLVAKNNKMFRKIGRQNRLLNTVNQVSSVLLEPESITDMQSDTSHFENTIHESLGFMAEAVGVNRICIWINSNDKNRLSFSLCYEWENGAFRSRSNNGILAPDVYFDEHPSWNEILSQGKCINSLVRDMPLAELAELTPRNIVSLFVVPVFFHDKFWGYVGFDNCRRERLIKENEMLILRSASRMIANTIIRNDMTQNLIETTAQLEIAKEQAEQSSRSKSTFLSQMSHEIRTPMNAILGITEIQLQKETLLPETGEVFGKIYESGELLLNIINDILDFSKIESGKLEIVSVDYNLPKLINDTTQLNRLRYESKPIELSLQLDENMPLELLGDELRIKQVLNNILSNAFKYTDQGRIEFLVSVESGSSNADETENVILVFRISDTGQGMTAEQLDRIFEEYARFNLEINRTTVGAGLGMSITKRLVDLMHGEILVESVPGSGSVFTVRLPQKRLNAEICGKTIIDKLKTFNFHSAVMMNKMQFLREYMPYGSVLVVDDVESNTYVAKGLLFPYGIKTDISYNAFDAIEKIKNGNVYDIIFMDHMMPKMDGIEAVKIIRGMGYNQPIVALTANALVGRAKMFLQNGFDSFLSKPIDSRELDIILIKFIKNRKPPEVVEAAQRITAAQRAQNQSLAGEDTKVSGIEYFFVRDAENAVNILENINISDSQTELYITTIHGIKSALANIGENNLSQTALELEKAARQKNLELLLNETPAFINMLKSLIVKYKPAEDAENASDNDSISEENRLFLHKKLARIITACDAYDKKSAKTAIDEIKSLEWPKHIKSLIKDISVHLLHSEFSEIAQLIDKFLKN